MSNSPRAVVIHAEWLSLAEALKFLKDARRPASLATLQRLVGRNAVRTAVQPVAGRKPERMYSREDLERIAKHDSGNTRTISGGTPRATSTEIALPEPTVQLISELMTKWVNLRREDRDLVPVREKLWLSITEAAALSGRTKGWLREACKEGRLVAEMDGGWKIKRSSLEAF